MKKLGRFLGRLLLAAAILAGLAIWYGTRLPGSPFDGLEAGPALPVETGEYAARVSDCVACHSTEHGPPFAGGLPMGTPLGTIHATNITPDPDYGIGTYTLADFDRAVRRGVAPDGRRLYPAMPYTSYAKLTDEDVAALYDYFMNHVKPVAQPNPQNDIPWPLSIRWPLEFWNLALAPTGTYQPDPAQDGMWNRGAYLVQAGGHCGACHTPRNAIMAEKGYDETAPEFLAGALLDGWYAPSLRGASGNGVGRWTEEELVSFLKRGRNRHAVVFGSMMEAFNNSTAFMTNEDLEAIAHYLKSLPRAPEPEWQYDGSTTAALAGGISADSRGAQVYLQKCSHCHGRDGKGRGEFVPPLAGASSVLAGPADSVVNITLNGAGRVVAGGVPDSYRMPPYRVTLSDRDIAAVATFVRQSWGNTGGPVTSEEVARLRAHTDPFSDAVILLQMR
ncbi:c-type cytochrome [Pseudogemmobacter humi]|uniref:Alcohol dehydrogenase cytochrome c subunit n=1 Tax=Pseudogemmobacter humi TaxID=2483812 RepID=A0A3P5WGN7_9RHOB|nr:cytochrome c [Pseudogemmobacter humi]VDC19850.1 Alcohol dehydrogenase cytochrome c subunit precursor [Pseudogemmobacter humi]